MTRVVKRIFGTVKEKADMEDGVGTIEIILILVVLIGLVILFKTQISNLLGNIFTEIGNQVKNVY